MRVPIEVRNELTIPATPERVWDVLTDVGDWPSWYRACQWVRLESSEDAEQGASFRWKAHPIELYSRVIASTRPHLFAFVADGLGVHAKRTFTFRPTADGSGTVVVSDETQVGWLPWLGRVYLAPRLRAANQAMFVDLARAAGQGRVTQAMRAAS
jgi:uncharacterized protein YndB with AHSA1/START domain